MKNAFRNGAHSIFYKKGKKKPANFKKSVFKHLTKAGLGAKILLLALWGYYALLAVHRN